MREVRARVAEAGDGGGGGGGGGGKGGCVVNSIIARVRQSDFCLSFPIGR